MLSPSARLRRSADIKATIALGRRIYNPLVRLYLVEKSAESPLRIACVVSKQVSASAVVRHRYQRLLRAAARLIWPTLAKQWRGDMVWVAQPTITSITSVQQLLDRLKPDIAQGILKDSL